METFRARPPTFEIGSLPSSLVSLQRGVAMILTSALGHLCKMNDITRYIIFGFRAEEPMTGRKFVHLEEGDSQQIVSEVSEKKDRYHAPETPDIDSGTPPKTEDNFRCT